MIYRTKVDEDVTKRVQRVFAEKSQYGDGRKFQRYSGICKTTFYSFLNGAQSMDIRTLKCFCTFFKVEPKWLLFGEGNRDTD